MQNNLILIVEDEPKLAQLLVDYLQQSGFDTNVIADGQQALDWIRHNHLSIDFIILYVFSIKLRSNCFF